MKQKKEKLIKILYPAIKRSRNHESKVLEYLQQKLREHGFSIGKTTLIYDGNISIEQIRNEDLFLFTKYLYEITNYEEIDIYKWYTDLEIETYNAYQEEQFYKDNKFIFKNTIQTSQNEFLVPVITYKEMSNIYNQGGLTYNFKTQRESVVVTFGEDFTRKIKIDNDKIQSILSLMKVEFKPNLLTINLRKTGTEQKNIYFDTKDGITGTLMLEVDNKNLYMDIIDGFNRWIAATNYYMDNPYSCDDKYFHLKFFNMTEEEAQNHLVREEKATPMNREHTETMDNSNIYITIAKDLNKMGGSVQNNVLYGNIADNYQDLVIQKKYTSVDIIARALKENFDLKDKEAFEIIEFKKYLVDFFAIVLGLLKKKYPNENIIYNANIFYGYITLAKRVKENKDWQTELIDIINDFDLNNDLINLLNKPEMKPTFIKQIIGYFKKEVI
jgi:hypothetical protein